MARFRRMRGASPVLALLACALLLRVLVPAGWMPVAHDGVLRLEPCPAWKPPARAQAVRHAPAHTPHGAIGEAGDDSSHGGGSSDQPCAFAGLSSPLAQADIASAIASVPARALLPIPHLLVGIGRGLAAPPPPSTGPPLFS